MTETHNPVDHVLVIKHGALGDIFQAFSAFASIRQAYPAAHLAVLTTSPYKELLRSSPWFDDVLIDDRAPVTNWHAIKYLWSLFPQFGRVIDLQNSNRTGLYNVFSSFRKKRPLWFNYNHLALTSPLKTLLHAREMHTLIRQDNFLKNLAIIPLEREIPDWLPLPENLSSYPLPPYIVIVPGSAGHRPAKRWPLTHFSALIAHLEKMGHSCVLIGTKEQENLAKTLKKKHENLFDFTGKTSLFELAFLLRKASLVIGNDTGPLHIAAAFDRPTLTFFSKESDPRRCAPSGLTQGYNRILSCDDLSCLTVMRVTNYLDLWLSELFNAKS